MKNYKLTIPKPCHEGWEKMTPTEKGRFCDLCSKTVVDFTKKSEEEIKNYLLENRGKRVCGHFKRSQLDSLVIQIPDVSFQRQLSFQKIFILALILAMGTTIFSCKTDEGKIQKIEKVELIDSGTKQVLDTLQVVSKTCTKDSVSTGGLIPPPTPSGSVPPSKPLGLPVIEPTSIEATGGIEIDSPEEEIETIEEIDEELIEGDIAIYCPVISTEPHFPDSTHKEFEKQIRQYIINNLSNIKLEKDYKFKVNFKVSKKGNIKSISLSKKNDTELQRTIVEALEKIPKLIPAQQRGIPVEVNYTLPFTFKVK